MFNRWNPTFCYLLVEPVITVTEVTVILDHGILTGLPILSAESLSNTGHSFSFTGLYQYTR